jgi:hypothetical protein
MTNNKKKKSQQTQMASTRRPSNFRAPRRGGGGAAHAALTKKVCSLTDPFCRASHGIRWTQDGNSVSITYQRRDLYTLLTGTTGNTMFQFTPGNGNSLNTAGIYSPNASTVAVAASNTGTFTLTNIATYRVVSAGCRWWDISAATDVGGYVIASEHPNYNTISGKNIATTNQNMSAHVETYDRRQPVTWISTPSDTNAYKFSSPADAVTTESSNRRSILTLAVTGANSTNILVVESVINYEFEMGADAFTSIMAGSSPNNAGNRFAAKVAYEMESTMSTFIARKADDAIKYIENLAWKKVKGAMVGGLLGGPEGALLAIEID